MFIRLSGQFSFKTLKKTKTFNENFLIPYQPIATELDAQILYLQLSELGKAIEKGANFIVKGVLSLNFETSTHRGKVITICCKFDYSEKYFKV